jgi:hypothetical protein
MGIDDVAFNMERCFINAIAGCIEVFWYVHAKNLCDAQVDTYRSIISNTQSHLVILHHVRVAVLNKVSIIAWENALLHLRNVDFVIFKLQNYLKNFR